MELAQYLGLSLSENTITDITQQCLEVTTKTTKSFSFSATIKHYWHHYRVLGTKSLFAMIPQIIRRKISGVRGASQLARGITQTQPTSDPKTLLQPDHFSSWQGKPGAWRHFFNQKQQTQLCTRYQSWLRQNDYAVDMT